MCAPAKWRWFIPMLLAFALPTYAAETLRRPLVIITGAGEGTIAGTSNAPHRLATAGREVYSGEIIQSGQEAISFAFCPGTSGKAGVFTLAERSSLQVLDKSLATSVSVRRVRDLAICVLPGVDTESLATTIDEPASRLATKDSLERRISALRSQEQSQLRQRLSESDNLSTQDSLITHTTRAALLEEAGLLDDALIELRTVRDGWPGATWSRDVISRLTKRAMTQPDLPSQLNESPGLSVESAAPACETAPGRTYALLIGISSYQSAFIPQLHFAHEDAKSFLEYLQSPRGGELPADQVRLLINEQATRDGIESAISELIRGKASCNNTLIIYVAAHGVLLCTDAEGGEVETSSTCADSASKPYILTFDSDAHEGKTTGIPMAEFRDMVAARTSDFGRVLVFVDVCHAGRLASLPPSTRLHSSEITDEFGSGSGKLGVLMGNSKARSPDAERSIERGLYGHGIFTFYTLLGLNQAVRPNSEGKVYFTDLSTYVTGEVLNATSHKQWPSAISADPTLVAVDDANKQGITLELPGKLADSSSPLAKNNPNGDIERGVGADIPADLISRFESAIQGNRLLPGEKDSAFDFLHELERSTHGTRYFQAASQRLRIGLEEHGQAVILKYLKGDQVPQVESDFRLGERYFRAALDLAPDASFDESRWLFCRGRAEIFEKKFQIARHTLDTAIGIDPERAYAYNALGIAYLEQIATQHATFDEALAAFRAAIRLAPYWAYPRHNLALAYAEAGNFDRAVATYEQARLLAPNYSYLPYNLGLLYQQMNEGSEARKAYKDALKIAKNDCSVAKAANCPAAARVLTALGVLNETEDRKRGAEKLYQSALQQDPNLIEAKHDLASLWTRSGKQPSQAEELWKQNLEAVPDHLPSLIGLSELLFERGDPKESLPYYDRILQLRPDYAPAILAVGRIRTATGDARAALMMLDDKEQLLHDNPDFWAARVEAHLSLNDLKSARSEYANALQLAHTQQQRTKFRREFAGRIRDAQ